MERKIITIIRSVGKPDKVIVRKEGANIGHVTMPVPEEPKKVKGSFVPMPEPVKRKSRPKYKGMKSMGLQMNKGLAAKRFK